MHPPDCHAIALSDLQPAILGLQHLNQRPLGRTLETAPDIEGAARTFAACAAMTIFFASVGPTSEALVSGPVGRCVKLPLGAPIVVLAVGAAVSREPSDAEPLLVCSIVVVS